MYILETVSIYLGTPRIVYSFGSLLQLVPFGSLGWDATLRQAFQPPPENVPLAGSETRTHRHVIPAEMVELSQDLRCMRTIKMDIVRPRHH